MAKTNLIFQFKLNEENWEDYQLLRLASSKKNNTLLLLINISVPSLLMIFILVLTKINYIIIALTILLSLIWILIVSPKVWNCFLLRKIKRIKVLYPNIKYSELTIEFRENEYTINNTKYDYETISMLSSFKSILFLKTSFNEEFLIPKAVIKDEAKLIGFIENKIK